MARTRTIKPGFFENEELAECSHAARLLFIALWMLADRNGYLEHRPRRIKRFTFGYEGGEVEPLIEELTAAGFLEPAQAEDGTSWLFIPTFASHQCPHPNEPARYQSESGQLLATDQSANAVHSTQKEGKKGKGRTEEGKKERGGRVVR